MSENDGMCVRGNVHLRECLRRVAVCEMVSKGIVRLGCNGAFLSLSLLTNGIITSNE